MATEKTYTTLRQRGTAEITDKRSIFIGTASPISTETEAMNFVREVKAAHPDANHNVFAYYLGAGEHARYSDDGEPQGTAGVPVLEIIRKNGFTDAVIVVTRYFGGVLLGTGGLVRAYSAAAAAAVNNAQIVTYDRFTVFTLKCDYSDHRRFQNEFLRFGVKQDECDFQDTITLTLAVKSSLYEQLTAKLNELSSGRALIHECGYRFDC